MVTSFYYTFRVPLDGDHHHGGKHNGAHHWEGGHTIWGVNKHYATPFALNSIIASIYWYVSCQFPHCKTPTNCSRIALFLFQIGYVWHLFSHNADYVNAAAGVGSHFIFNNLLQFGWVMLFVRSHYIWAEVLLVVNFFNLSSLYFRHNTHPRFIHIPVVSGPLAWTFVALYWNGAIAVNSHHLAARILANVAIWGILVYGLFFLVIFKVSQISIILIQH